MPWRDFFQSNFIISVSSGNISSTFSSSSCFFSGKIRRRSYRAENKGNVITQISSFIFQD
jgi:hypothetical protein